MQLSCVAVSLRACWLSGEYNYDVLNRMIEAKLVKRNGSMLITPETTSYHYDGLGRLKYEYNDATGVTKLPTYDAFDRVDQLTHFDDIDQDGMIGPAENTLVSFDYTHDSTGNRVGSIETFDRSIPQCWHSIISLESLTFSNILASRLNS